MNLELVPIKEACRLWHKDRRTLKSWARRGLVLYDAVGDENSAYTAWYIETPAGRQARVFNN